jgi:hypothetical protein
MALSHLLAAVAQSAVVALALQLAARHLAVVAIGHLEAVLCLHQQTWHTLR